MQTTHRIVICRREYFWELKNRMNDTLIIKIRLTQLPNRIASPTARERCTTKDCRSPTTCTVSVKIENAPELLLIRAPSRSVTADDNDFFKDPFTKTIDLSAYSAGGDSLVYNLHSMTLQLGYCHRRTGHSSPPSCYWEAL